MGSGNKHEIEGKREGQWACSCGLVFVSGDEAGKHWSENKGHSKFVTPQKRDANPSKILLPRRSVVDSEEKKRQEDFCDSLLPTIMRRASDSGMGKVATYLLGMAVGFCGEAGADEFEILEAVIDGINDKRCIICGQFSVHMHGGKQYP